MFESKPAFISKVAFTSKLGFESHSGDTPPPVDDSLFNRPFNTGSLDDIKSGLDVNYRDGIGNNPIFDSNGWRLQQSTTARGFAPVSTAQVDEGCFLGDFTNGSYINGVQANSKNMTFLGSANSGKYFTKVTGDLVGTALTASNGLIVEITAINNTVTFAYAIVSNPTGLSDADAAQQGFEYPNTFKLDFSGSTLPLSDTKQLRLDVGDGSSWVDFPTNDFEREIEFVVNNSSLNENLLSARYVDQFNAEGIAAPIDGGNLKIVAFSFVAGVTEVLAVNVSGYSLGGAITSKVIRRSSGISELIVEYNGSTFTDSNTFNSDTIQSISCVYGSTETPATEPYDFTLISEKVTAL